MQILSITSQKGGVGKTTLAMNLAVAAAASGTPTIVFDLDPQTSAMKYYDRRIANGGDEQPIVASIQMARLPHELKAAIDDGYELAIVDTPPNVSGNAVHIAQAGDLILIPVEPSAIDLDAIQVSIEIARLSGRPGYAVLNLTDPPYKDKDSGEFKPTQETLMAQTIIEEQFEFPVAPQFIARRKPIKSAAITGQGVLEIDPKGNGTAEIQALWKWVKASLKAVQKEDAAAERKAANG